MYEHLYKPFIETHGKPFTNYAEVLEQGAADQMSEVLRHPWVLKGALMPDAHQGYTLPIGGVVACEGMISPAFVGVDVGCGVCAQKIFMDLDLLHEKRFEIRDAIAQAVPLGFNHQKDPQDWPEYEDMEKTDWFALFFAQQGGFNQLGTLGGGNHFIEVGIDEHKAAWIVIHSGSRGVGNKAARHYMGEVRPANAPKEGVYGTPVDGELGKDYIMDLNVLLAFALENRVQMIKRILEVLTKFDPKVEPDNWFINRTHNHAEEKDGLWIHRKGATHAEDKMMGVVPGNALHGSYIVSGKGNPDSLFSSSHGAGRILGRKAAERELDLELLQLQVEESGIAYKAEGISALQESPDAYKNPGEVMALQKDLVDIVAHVRPELCVKG